MNDSVNFLNVGNSTLCNEGNAWFIMFITVIKQTVENNYTHILHGPLKRYIYGYMISKSTISEAKIQNII